MNRLAVCLALIVSMCAAALDAGDWPAWRGADFTGATAAGNYPTRWSPNTAAWKVTLPGKGASTPIVLQNRIYLTTPADGRNAVMALDMDGKQLWLTKLGPESKPRHKKLGTSCNSSPITDGQAIYTRFRSGEFVALNLDGSVRWRIDLTKQFGPENYIWDQGSSPIVTDRHVIYARMHEGDSWVAGFNKTNGKLEWQVKRNYKVPKENDNGYTTPVLFDYMGRQAILIWGADHLTAHVASNGKLIWSCGKFNPEQTGFWPAIASPVVHNGVAVVPVGRDDRKQGWLEGVRLNGRGDVSTTHRLWKRDDLRVFCCTPALWQGRAYLLRDREEVVCIDPATGRTLSTIKLPSRAKHYASPVIANGILYIANADGEMFTIQITGSGMKLLAKNDMDERIIATPVAVNDRLLIRTDETLFCIAGK